MTGLNNWIAQSESWRACISFNLADDLEHPFFARVTDYYVASLGRIFDELRSDDSPNKQSIFLQIAQGLEIFSLSTTRSYFKGIDYRQNTLLIATLHYLAGYPASSYLIASWIDQFESFTDIEQFIYSFLLRKQLSDDELTRMLFQFMNSGNENVLRHLEHLIEHGKEQSLASSPRDYVAFSLANALIKNFKQSNVWSILNNKISQDNLKRYLRELTLRPNPIWEYFPSQTLAINSGLLDASETVSLQMPTSAGKTAICELVIYDYLSSHPGHKAVFLVPYRALASELRETLCKSLQRLNIKTKTLYGGSAPTVAEKSDIEETDLLIITPEKFLALEAVIPNLFRTFQLIVCDEGHLINSGERGISYELLLTKLKSFSVTGRKFVFASAIIPNIQELHQWLGGQDNHLVQSSYRPAGIDYAFLDNEKENSSLIFNPTKQIPEKYILKKFLVKSDFLIAAPNQKRPKLFKHNSIRAKTVAVALKTLNLGTVAIFTTQKIMCWIWVKNSLSKSTAYHLPSPARVFHLLNLGILPNIVHVF